MLELYGAHSVSLGECISLAPTYLDVMQNPSRDTHFPSYRWRSLPKPKKWTKRFSFHFSKLSLAGNSNVSFFRYLLEKNRPFLPPCCPLLQQKSLHHSPNQCCLHCWHVRPALKRQSMKLQKLMLSPSTHTIWLWSIRYLGTFKNCMKKGAIIGVDLVVHFSES